MLPKIMMRVPIRHFARAFTAAMYSADIADGGYRFLIAAFRAFDHANRHDLAGLGVILFGVALDVLHTTGALQHWRLEIRQWRMEQKAD